LGLCAGKTSLLLYPESISQQRGRQDFFLCQQLMQVSPAKYSVISIREGCCLTAPRNCTRLGCLTLVRTSVSCQKYFSTILSVNKDGQMVLTSIGGLLHIALLISPDEPFPMTLSLRSNSEGDIFQSMLCDEPDPSRALTQASSL